MPSVLFGRVNGVSTFGRTCPTPFQRRWPTVRVHFAIYLLGLTCLRVFASKCPVCSSAGVQGADGFSYLCPSFQVQPVHSAPVDRPTKGPSCPHTSPFSDRTHPSAVIIDVLFIGATAGCEMIRNVGRVCLDNFSHTTDVRRTRNVSNSGGRRQKITRNVVLACVCLLSVSGGARGPIKDGLEPRTNSWPLLSFLMHTVHCGFARLPSAHPESFGCDLVHASNAMTNACKWRPRNGVRDDEGFERDVLGTGNEPL